MQPILYIVIPCYNEEQVLPITCSMFLEKIKSLVQKEKISDESRVIFVNDGSKDKTCSLQKKITIIRESARAETADTRMQFSQD